MFKYKQLLIKILQLCSLTMIISAFIYSVQSYSFNIGLFNDYDIYISGNDYIETKSIENEIYPQISSSLLSVNLSDIQNKLESIEYIEAVQVSRILPRTLMIQIVERSPMLVINNENAMLIMDRNGILLSANDKAIGNFPVPVLSILEKYGSIEQYTRDINLTFQFLINEYPIFYQNLSEVIIKADVWEFYSDNNTKIFVDANYLINQLNILQIFEKTLYPVRDLQDYLYIDLRIKDQVIVKEKTRRG